MRLAIYGCGGLGREIFDVALRRNALSELWQELVFVDDFQSPGECFGAKVIDFQGLIREKGHYECIVAVGEPSGREKLFDKLSESGLRVTSLIDTTAIISPTASIGAGSIVCEYATIHTGVRLGANTLIQPFCDIGHDIQVGEHTVLSPYCVPGGNVVIGKRVFVGLHCAIKESLVIGSDAIIAMGSAVFRDVPDGSTVVGNPARITKGNDQRKIF